MKLWMKACLSLAVLACWLSPVVRAEDNPFKKAEVGDWVSYKTVTEMPNVPTGGMAMETKQTVTAKTEKEVTMKVETLMNGNSMGAQEIKIPLDQPYDPTKTTNGKVEKLGEGEESISVGGKTYACKWVKIKTQVEANGMKIDTESKYWTSPEVPLGGLVKNDTSTSMNMKMHMELTGAGKK